MSAVAWTLIIISALVTNGDCAELEDLDYLTPGNLGKVQFQIHNQLATLRLGNLAMVVDASFGGRITEFSLDGKNALVSAGELTGSTFWTSPQKDWGWPPPPVIDTDPFELHQHEGHFKLISAIDPTLGVRVEKTFRGNAHGNGFDITYTLRNMSDRTLKLAPWEVTRVSGGYFFYPTLGNQIRSDLKTTEVEGITWYFYQANELSDGGSHKVLDDGAEGWIANANPETGLLLIKSYSDISANQFAPNEAEVELYASTRQNYVEIELQGAYTSIPPKTSVDWMVTWYLQHIGARSVIGIGDPEIVRRVRTALQ